MSANESTRGTHQLESAKGGTSQVAERRRASEGDSLPAGCRRRDKSGHRKEVSEVPTSWRAPREGQPGQVKTPKKR